MARKAIPHLAPVDDPLAVGNESTQTPQDSKPSPEVAIESTVSDVSKRVENFQEVATPYELSLDDDRLEGIHVRVPASLASELTGRVQALQSKFKRHSKQELVSALLWKHLAEEDSLEELIRDYRHVKTP